MDPTRLARLRIACMALHPDRVRTLLTSHDPGTVVDDARQGKLRLSDQARSVLAWSDDQLVALVSGMDVLMAGDDGYPRSLVELPDAPDVLFVRGTIPSSPMVAVVGTRRCTTYGTRVATAAGRAIAAAGWPVVSGLARGIDGAAQRATVAVGQSVAVLGSGIDRIYPSEHDRLADDIVQSGGAVVSEYPPGIRPDAWRFPPRNRIISGLSEAVVVIEAPVKGGSLITAAHALEHGRPLFAVPGDIDRETSRGCNLLVRDGAFPVLDIDDLMTGLSFCLGPPPRAQHTSVSTHVVYEAVGATGCHLDELPSRLALPPSEVLVLISHAEADGHVTVEQGYVMRR